MNEITSKYGIIAIEAACAASHDVDPLTAWQVSAAKIFADSPSSEHKGCPKSAFLGLAELGEIAGVNPGKYTKSIDNKRYAKDALALLREDDSLSNDPLGLWRRVMGGVDKSHNCQMDVVFALWEARKFIGQRGFKDYYLE